MNLTVEGPLIDAMIDHARKIYPQEACGILAGRGGNAARFIPLPNALASETAYEIDPGLLAATLRGLRDNAETLIAIFHSHPRGPAQPSTRDLELSYYPETFHIIVSLASPDQPQIRAFRIIDGGSFEIELHAIV
jgi:proteasome lid subunit RPN8/RPN11